MKDQKFDVYDHAYRDVSFFGEIKDGCLQLTSLVFGEDYDSEKNYFFDRETVLTDLSGGLYQTLPGETSDRDGSLPEGERDRIWDILLLTQAVSKGGRK